MIIWVSGEESTFDQTFNASEQLFVRQSLLKEVVFWRLVQRFYGIWMPKVVQMIGFASDVFAASLGE